MHLPHDLHCRCDSVDPASVFKQLCGVESGRYSKLANCRPSVPESWTLWQLSRSAVRRMTISSLQFGWNRN